jgi:NAD-dependent dihydropyrimidine dehydrogenase PreA subunit
MLEDLLKKEHCFKLICGAGNEDCESVRKLVYLYALAGCRFFDLSANEMVIETAKEALKSANVTDAYICVSIGIKGDPHSNKAVINYDKCINCGSCESICPQDAIHYAKVKKSKCIGCSRCAKVCPRQAISYISEAKELDEIMPVILENNVDCIEFHIIGQDKEEILTKWEYLNTHFNGLLSICISRGKMGDEDLISTINDLVGIRKPYTTIIQADGFPMSGGNDDYKTTLQAVATAEIVQNTDLPVYLMLSGGTNSKTAQLAKMCGINFQAVAVGSFARKIVKKYIERPDFWTNQNVIDQAVDTASSLIKSLD